MRAVVPAPSIVVVGFFFWALEENIIHHTRYILVLCPSLCIVETSKALEGCDVPLRVSTQESELCFGQTLEIAGQDFSVLVCLSSAAHSSGYWATLLLQALISNDCWPTAIS